jgi:hypothetical protein
MPNPSRKKEGDYMRFRPLHTFTTTPPDQTTGNRKALWKIVWIVGVVILMFIAAIVCVGLLAGCGSHPPTPDSRTDILLTSAAQTHLDLRSLPVSDFPALTKFQKLREVQMPFGSGTDEKLRALAELKLPSLECVVVIDSPGVTDHGVAALGKMQSLTAVGLRGTSMTDAGIETLRRLPKLKSVSLAGSVKITFDGVLRLAKLETLEEFSFPAGDLSQAEVLELIRATPSVKHLQISEPKEERLDLPALRNAAKAKGMMLLKVHDNAASDL